MKQLILTADDFGRSPEINAAIERAHQAGFLTQASLMVNEGAVSDAVQIARRNAALCVGLHLTLCDGQATRVSPLTDDHGRLPRSPALSGVKYYFAKSLGLALRDEIRGQFERFRALEFAPSYWDGHTHLHLHPTILNLTLPVAAEHSFRSTRLVREPGVPAIVPTIFRGLSRAAIPKLQKHRIGFADQVFGLRATGRMSTERLATILKNLPEGVSEIYFHPGAEPEEIDYAALKPLLAEHQITLVSALTPPRDGR